MVDYEFTRRTMQEIQSTVQSDSVLGGLWRDLCSAAVRYANFRSQCALGDAEFVREIDRARAQAHDAFISTCNALSRNMGARDHDVAWRRTLGDAATVAGRKSIGDFACYMQCCLAISAR